MSTKAADGLREWSESPTSPRHRGVNRFQHEENWDDDFIDNTDSPSRPGRGSRRSRLASKASDDMDQENWDEELGLIDSISNKGPIAGSSNLSTMRSRRDIVWDLSDDEGGDAELHPLNNREDEDKTVTSRSRRRPLGTLDSNDVPVPPLPPLPAFLPTIPSGDVPGLYDPPPFPRSPTHSVFSIPATTTSHGGRDSLNYGSTAHLSLHLRRTHSAESSSPIQQKFTGRFPSASPETPRERRRLRKKSRPPHLDASILELDDKAVSAPETSPFLPDAPERPSTPPRIAATISSPTTPSSSVSPIVPKSPLLVRIGSMRHWGVGPKRKQMFTGGTGKISSPLSTVPPFSNMSSSIEADRFDNNRTPRPRSYISPPERQTPPIVTTPSTPKRFFRGSSGGANEDTPMSSNEDVTLIHEWAKERERERERITLPAPMLQPQSSQSGESDLGVSPRKMRIKAFGQRIIAGATSSSRGASPDGNSSRSVAGEKSNLELEKSSQTSVKNGKAPSSSHSPLSPQANESRLRPRLPHHAPSNLKYRPVFPRHVSGSAIHDHLHVHAPALGSRSVSASTNATSSEDLSHGGNSGSDGLGPSERKDRAGKDGHRSFMGSMRRISLGSSHKRRQRNENIMVDSSDDCRTPSTSRPAIPSQIQVASPVESHRAAIPGNSSQFSPFSEYGKNPTSISSKIPTAGHSSLATSVDLTSPSSSPPFKDRLPVRRSGEHPVLTHSKSSSFATSSPGRGAPSPVSRVSNSPQAASLGRASPLPNASSSSPSNVLRRNSLGDLKIPSRISRAQDGLKRDLGRVREFAAHVERKSFFIYLFNACFIEFLTRFSNVEMQELRSTYFALANQIQIILETPPAPSRASSPTIFFGLSRSNSRARSKTNPPPPPTIDYKSLALSFQSIDNKYRIAWECADLLIELGTGAAPEPTNQHTPSGNSGNPNSAEPPRQNRERAVTLDGSEGKPDIPDFNQKSPVTPTIVSWRASTATGRHDPGHRQLYLLREMLNNPNSAKEEYQFEDTESLINEGHWTNEGMSSSLTLPTDESAATNSGTNSLSPTKKRRRGSVLGMIGIRDMLRSLKRSTARAQHIQPDVGNSSTASGTNSSLESSNRHFDYHPYNTVSGIHFSNTSSRRKSETNAVLIHDALRSPSNDYNAYINGLSHKSSPRRPSLASLFRIGQRHKNQTAGCSERTSDVSNKLDDLQAHDPNKEYDSDSDWDRMDSTSDIDVQLEAINSTIESGFTKLRKKSVQPAQVTSQTSRKPAITDQISSSLTPVATPDQSLVNVRQPRLSNVDENFASGSSRHASAASEAHRRPVSRGKDRPFSSVRTVPPKPSKGLPLFDAPADLKLAMTPENIKPLLDNARVVNVRLQNCLAEVRGLLIRTEGSTYRLSASTSNVALSPTPP